MKTITNDRFIFKNKLNVILAILALLVVGLACGSNNPPPAQYVGVWTSGDGTVITIRSDGSADYKSASSSVSGGGAVVDEAAKTLKISMASMGPTLKIDKPPTASEMTLDGIVFKKNGGGPATTGNANSSSVAKTETPSNEKLQALVKSTFMDFSSAVQSEDFTEFHKKTATVWRDSSSPDELSEAFQSFTENKADYDFKNAVGQLDATFSPAPALQKVSGIDALVLKGYYPTKPQRTDFELKYAMEDTAWKLIGINIKTTGE